MSLNLKNIATENDLVYTIAKRVRELADKKMTELRSINGYGCSTEQEAQQKDRGMTRGEVIEAIIIDEFCQESPRTLTHEE